MFSVTLSATSNRFLFIHLDLNIVFSRRALATPVCSPRRIGLFFTREVQRTFWRTSSALHLRQPAKFGIVDSPILLLTVHSEGCYNEADHRLKPVSIPKGNRSFVLPRQAGSLSSRLGMRCSRCPTLFAPSFSRLFHLLAALYAWVRGQGSAC